MEDQAFLDPAQTISEKARRRQERKAERRNKAQTRNPSVFEPRTENQRHLFEALKTYPVVIATGPQGTGKTYVSARHAIRQLMSPASFRQKIILTRPPVSDPRHRLGFQPGGINAKMRPWLVPIFDAFRDEVSNGQLDKMMQAGVIEIVPYEFMQGRTFHDSCIIVDEAENCSFRDLELVITRTGENSTLMLAGDSHQALIDDTGLDRIARMVGNHGLNAAVIEFSPEDVVRSDVAKEWVRAFRAEAAFGGDAPNFLGPKR